MPSVSSPKFSALICHWDGRRDPQCKNPDFPIGLGEDPGLRVFKFELTNDTSNYNLGEVVCPEAKEPSVLCNYVKAACLNLETLAQDPKETFLEKMRELMFKACSEWNLGENENFNRSRLGRLLKDSTADVRYKDNQTISVIMDWSQSMVDEPLEKTI